MAHVREKPPLRHMIDVQAPGGRHYRLGEDEPDPANVFSGLRYSDTMPGGFETADCTLPREPGVEYPDLERLSDWRVLGVGGEPYWEGRLERVPRTSGDEVSVSPSAAGWQSHLDDDKSCREIYVDRDLSRWGDAPLARQSALTAGNFSYPGGWSHSVGLDASTPALVQTHTELNQPGATRQIAEHWYDARGLSIGSLYYDLSTDGLGAGADANWSTSAILSTDNIHTAFDLGTDHNGASATATLTATADNREWATVNAFYDASYAARPQAGGWSARWRKLAVYGNHGLTLRGTEPSAGFYASDVVRHAVQTFAPMLQIKPDSIQQSSFVIPQLAFLEPTTCSEIVRQASRFNLPDWGVWDGKEFVWQQAGARGRTWRLRIGPSQLEETGPQADRVWESVVVQYNDVDGTTRTVGPTGSGADTESSDLKDSDPDNPANKLGITRRDILTMGVSTVGGATEVGRRFLEQSKLLDRSGKARVVGWVEDDRGVLHPFSAIRSGDYAVFVDAADTAARKIVRTDKDYDSRTCTLDLDAPPEGLQQLLERLGVVLVPLGL